MEKNENIHLADLITGRKVDFGEAGTEQGLAWGIEIEIPITDRLVRAVLTGGLFKLPPHIKKIVFLELAPQEALRKEDRTIRSNTPPRISKLREIAAPNKPYPKFFEKMCEAFNLLTPVDQSRIVAIRDMISWIFGPGNDDVVRFEQSLEQSNGDTLVIVHGHSDNLTGMGEQYPDETRNGEGFVLQKKHNFVPMHEILKRYNDPQRFAAIVLNGCNHEQGTVTAKNVPVFYPTRATKYSGNPRFPWYKRGGASIPNPPQ